MQWQVPGRALALRPLSLEASMEPQRLSVRVLINMQGSLLKGAAKSHVKALLPYQTHHLLPTTEEGKQQLKAIAPY